MLGGSEIQLLKDLCEQEKTQFLTILMLSMDKTRLAGYMLTGNRSMLLSTDSSLAWLSHCPSDALSTICDEPLLWPIFYKNAIFFVDPITRLTYPDDPVQNCSDRMKNLFLFDMADENSWFIFTPTLEHRKHPAVFGPKDVTPVSRRTFGGAGHAGIYTSTVIWILGQYPYQRCFKESFTKLLSTTHCPQHSNSWAGKILLLCPGNVRTYFYVDNMISPSYFKNQFMDTFGSVAYVFEFCGIYFSCFVVIKFIVDLIVMILRHMEINRLTGASIWFGETLLSASYLIVSDVYSNVSIQSPSSPFASVGTWTNANKNRRRH